MLTNNLSMRRHRQHWSQKQLGDRAGLSRTEISAIETGRVIPSTAAAISLARVFDCQVEELFSLKAEPERQSWAWPPSADRGCVWQANIQNRRLVFPTEWTLAGTLPHDGTHQNSRVKLNEAQNPERTLVIAGCDPAVALLAAQVTAVSNFRVIPLNRSSQAALRLLEDGVVHAAGLHFSTGTSRSGNRSSARNILKKPFRLLRLAQWEEGLALDPSLKTGSIRSVLTSRLRWVGREEGSSARECLDQILGDRRKPQGYQYQAQDHHGVTETIRCGWAQAGICVRLPAQERGLRFLKVRTENYDLCFPAHAESEPAIQALLTAVRSNSYRRDLGQLPGYDTNHTGELN
jgi:molybdate-binding protein/DNA-binding XRE family transcriptional regulator